MDLVTAHYIIHYFPRLLTQEEASALIHYNTLTKIGAPEKYNSTEAYQQRLNSHKERHHITENPEVLKLLESGIEHFYLNTAARIQEQAVDKVYFNYCPKCKQLARTPYAKQCRHCGYNWHYTVRADFRISLIFELQTQPSTLFIAGDLVKGTIKEGMSIDLTFLGVAAKPRIADINYLDHIADKRTQLTLSVRVNSTEDREYLKKRGSLAVPITIEG